MWNMHLKMKAKDFYKGVCEYIRLQGIVSFEDLKDSAGKKGDWNTYGTKKNKTENSLNHTMKQMSVQTYLKTEKGAD